MDPSRKRRIRLVVALTAAICLAAALMVTTFSAASPERIPSQLIASAEPGKTYKLGGKVVSGSIERTGDTMTFQVRDPKGHATVPVTYTGAVPDPFREGREVIVTVEKNGTTFVGERDSLVTKCPSKFTAEPKNS
ncbi:MAG: cytochrome c maturation protein CcmE [Solirubrobacteraceae bacterium]|nr:cytochrome c maturation protein CcmE [Solirubrobacteraceae bacterium]